MHIQKVALISASEVGQWKVKRFDEDVPGSRRRKKPQPLEDAQDEAQPSYGCQMLVAARGALVMMPLKARSLRKKTEMLVDRM